MFAQTEIDHDILEHMHCTCPSQIPTHSLQITRSTNKLQLSKIPQESITQSIL
jgi:hypothetical protein